MTYYEKLTFALERGFVPNIYSVEKKNNVFKLTEFFGFSTHGYGIDLSEDGWSRAGESYVTWWSRPVHKIAPYFEGKIDEAYNKALMPNLIECFAYYGKIIP